MPQNRIVTGSSRGIGAAIALKLASHGADVVINYVASAQSAEAVAARARDEHGVRAVCVQADVSNRDDIARLFGAAKKELGRVDIVMSNSGIEHFGDIETVTGEEIDKVFAVNVKAQFFVAQEAYKVMENGGRLILISSISAAMGFPRHAIYSASKAAITGMIKCLAWDFGSKQITVNAIAPGGIKSDMYAQAAADYFPNGKDMTIDEIDAKVSAWSPLGRPGMPDDIAGVVALVASPESQWLTGQTFHVGGGAHMATS
ncbi:NAD(P)-binding protein [Cryphonectria parasitica EP155]|uniref:NAD(P)-binding protein n=1 Tax=Cryphonectria parasitica (strain ATCC 38755 / EP155) TaxID=660469 RepID=A0A9P5CQL9_CRYP1|nr:NAD(P)-binding protein [Cryphonectria parasitica EP155]KAF3766205.1 NAD(P)-binding protein [Cryphonectria parasitica EP155]